MYLYLQCLSLTLKLLHIQKLNNIRITTGRSTAERELEENLASSLKELLVERRGNRLGVSEIRRQLGEILNTQVQPEDLTDILKVMDADGLVQFNVSRECSLLFLCSCDCIRTHTRYSLGEGTNCLCPCWCYWLEE